MILQDPGRILAGNPRSQTLGWLLNTESDGVIGNLLQLRGQNVDVISRYTLSTDNGLEIHINLCRLQKHK